MLLASLIFQRSLSLFILWECWRASLKGSRPKKCTVQALNTLNFGLYTKVCLLKTFGLTLTDITEVIFIRILNHPLSLEIMDAGLHWGPVDFKAKLSQTFPVLSSARCKSPPHNQYPSLFLLPISSKGSSGKVTACHPICSSSYCFLNHSSKQATNRRMSYNTSSSTLSQAFHNSQDKLGWHYYFYCYCFLICASKIRKIAQWKKKCSFYPKPQAKSKTKKVSVSINSICLGKQNVIQKPHF